MIDPKKIEQMINELGAPGYNQVMDEITKGDREVPSLFPAWLHLNDADDKFVSRFPVILRVHGVIGVKLRFSLQTMALFKNLDKGTYSAVWANSPVSFGTCKIPKNGQQVLIQPSGGVSV